MKKLLSAVLSGVLLFLCCFNIPANALEAPNANIPVIYLAGSSGDDANEGTSPENAVKTLESAYEKLLAYHDNELINQAGASGIIVVCSTTTLGEHFNLDRRFQHKGKIIITSQLNDQDYRQQAKLQFSCNGEQAVQLGGPTEFNDIILNRTTSSAYVFYSVDSLTMGQGVINQHQGNATSKSETYAGMQGKFIVRGGYYGQHYTGDLKIDIQSGTYWFVSGANATAGGGISGNINISIGGTAWVAAVVPGTQQAASEITNSVITVDDEAVIHTLTASGDFGNIQNSEFCLLGGTVHNFLTTRSGKNGTVTNFKLILENSAIPSSIPVEAQNKEIVIRGGKYDLDLGCDWNRIEVKEKSELSFSSPYPEYADFTVEYGSRIFLPSNERLFTWTGCGAVWIGNHCYRNSHVWTEDNRCSVCGADRYTVFVDADARENGDGYCAEEAVQTLEEAYEKLLSGTDNPLLENPDFYGNLVICGDVVIDGNHFNLDGHLKHTGTVQISSVSQGTDYGKGQALYFASSLFMNEKETNPAAYKTLFRCILSIADVENPVSVDTTELCSGVEVRMLQTEQEKWAIVMNHNDRTVQSRIQIKGVSHAASVLDVENDISVAYELENRTLTFSAELKGLEVKIISIR